MLTIDQQIEEIEEVLRKTPHHKATNGFIGAMRAKIARLRDKDIETQSKSGGNGTGGFTVKKQGDATVVLIGPPSAGKSTLINQLTNAESKVAPYAFTTVTVVPGMLKHNEAYIQILDIPGLIQGAKEGKGRGKEVLSVARNADLLLIMTDVKRIEAFASMVNELTGAGIRLNQKAPEVLIDKKTGGGLEIHSNVKQSIDKDTIKEIAREYGIKSGDITLRENMTINRLFDAFSSNRVYVPAIFVINKIDEMPNYKNSIDGKFVGICASKRIGVDELIDQIWRELKFVTVYILDDAMIMKEGETLRDVALKIGSEFSQKVKFAKINGAGAKFTDQEVSLDTKVTEKMKIKFI